MRKKNIFVFISVCFFSLFFSVQAEEIEKTEESVVDEELIRMKDDSTKQNSQVEILADINIYNVKIWEEKLRHLKLSFDLENHLETRSDLVYGLEIIKENPDKSVVLMDEKIFSDDLLLVEKNKKVYREIDYYVPEYLSGEFILWLKIKDESGLVLAQQSFFVGFSGTWKLIEQSNPCYLTVGNDEKKYNLAEGVSLKKDEKLFLNCYTKNNLGDNVSLKPYFEFYRRTFYGLKLEERAGKEGIHFEKDEGRLNKMVIPLPASAQAYDVKITFKKENKNVSNPIIAHFVLSGKSASINSLILDKNQYAKGDTAHLDMLWSGSADTFSGSRTGSSGLVDPIFKIEIKDQRDLKFCAPEQTKKAGDIGKIIDILLDKDCLKPIATVKIFDEGELLYEKTIATQEMTAEEKSAWEKDRNQEKILKEGNFFQKNKEIFWLVGGLILVFVLILLWFFRKKKPVLMLLFLLFSSLLITEKTQAVTATLYGDPWYMRIAASVVYEANFVPLSDCGDMYSCFPYCDPFGVKRIIDNCLISSKVVRHEGRYYGCYRDIVSFNYSLGGLLSGSRINQGQTIQANGSANGDNICNNGTTVGMAVSPKNDGVNLFWVLNNNYISPDTSISASGSYPFSTAGYTCGGYNSAFYYAYKHGYTDNILGGYDKIGSGLVGYTVQNCCTATCPTATGPGCSGSQVANAVVSGAGVCCGGQQCYQCASTHYWTGSYCKQREPQDGVCGTASGQIFPSTATGWGDYPICSVGIFSPISLTFPSMGSTASWTCLGAYGGTNANCSASRAVAPSLSFGASPNPVTWNNSVTLSWTTTSATSCWASGDWTGWKSNWGGSETISGITSPKTYILECWNSANETTGQRVISVGVNYYCYDAGYDLNNSALCPNDDSGLTSQVAHKPVSSCTDATKCEHACNSGYVLFSNQCVLPLPGECNDEYNGRAICSLPDDEKKLCKLGVDPINITFSSNKWTWTCPSPNVGVSASCSARKECPWIEVEN